MIIGTGLIANSLKKIDAEDCLYFASGVSNSLETRSSEFERERALLESKMQEYPVARLIYFSTLSINDQSKQNSPYVLHKKKTEDYITKNSDHYLILRIGNIVGNGGNPNTLFNYLKTKISSQTEFTVHTKARRLLIDIDDIALLLQSHGKDIRNTILNCAYPYYYNMKEIIASIEEHLNKKAAYEETDEGDFYTVDFDEQISRYFSETDPHAYLNILAGKYI